MNPMDSFVFVVAKSDMATNLVNGRCYLVPIVSTLSELKNHMTRKHWELLNKTPFVSLMDIEPIIQERVVLDALMQLYDECSNKF